MRGPPRIIPARAGFTTAFSAGSPDAKDHPRSRGVYSTACRRPPGSRGSSPLARGLPRGRAGRPLGRGIIPARAGFTTSGTARSTSIPDHPRSRGVYPHGRWCSFSVPGSSPLARGLLLPNFTIFGTTWIIPARAGFTLPGVGGRDPRGDHPRSRGVYSRSPPARTLTMGSSPLARGLP